MQQELKWKQHCRQVKTNRQSQETYSPRPTLGEAQVRPEKDQLSQGLPVMPTRPLPQLAVHFLQVCSFGFKRTWVPPTCCPGDTGMQRNVSHLVIFSLTNCQPRGPAAHLPSPTPGVMHPPGLASFVPPDPHSAPTAML